MKIKKELILIENLNCHSTISKFNFAIKIIPDFNNNIIYYLYTEQTGIWYDSN